MDWFTSWALLWHTSLVVYVAYKVRQYNFCSRGASEMWGQAGKAAGKGELQVQYQRRRKVASISPKVFLCHSEPRWATVCKKGTLQVEKWGLDKGQQLRSSPYWQNISNFTVTVQNCDFFIRCDWLQMPLNGCHPKAKIAQLGSFCLVTVNEKVSLAFLKPSFILSPVC